MSPKKPNKINVHKLIEDCGGPQTVAQVTGIKRTNVYSIMRRGRMNTDQLASIIRVFASIDVRDYMVK